MLAALRPDAWNLPLFLHVLGAMTLTGALGATASALLAARRATGAPALVLTRLGLRSVLAAVLPSFLVMRVAAQWLESEEGLDRVPEEPGWLVVGYVTTDGGAVLLLAAAVAAAVALRRLRSGRGAGRLATVVAVAAGVQLGAYLVAAWAMTAKPF